MKIYCYELQEGFLVSSNYRNTYSSSKINNPRHGDYILSGLKYSPAETINAASAAWMKALTVAQGNIVLLFQTRRKSVQER